MHDMNDNKTIIYIGNIPTICTKDDLVQLFSAYGKITHCKIPHNYFDESEQMDYAFVKLETIDQTIQAINQLHNKKYKDSFLIVRPIQETENIKVI